MPRPVLRHQLTSEHGRMMRAAQAGDDWQLKSTVAKMAWLAKFVRQVMDEEPGLDPKETARAAARLAAAEMKRVRAAALTGPDSPGAA
jgi:hypothetical protein